MVGRVREERVSRKNINLREQVEKSRNTVFCHHMSKPKCSKHLIVGAPLEVDFLKKARGCGAKRMSKSKCQNTPRSDHFWTLNCPFSWQAQWILHLATSEPKCEGLVAVSKSTVWVGRLKFEEDLQKCILCGRHSTRDIFIRHVRRSGH